MRRKVAIAIHDVAPQTVESCARLMALIQRVSGGEVPVTLLVVPVMHRREPVEESSACRAFVDRALEAGSEVALHGHCHLDSDARSPSLRVSLSRRFLSDGEAEFAAIAGAEARSRIEQGLAAFDRCDWRTRGFVPPAWQMSDAAAAVLAEFPLDYVTSLGSLTRLREGRAFRVPCLGLSARSNTRRALSLRWARWWTSRFQRVPHLRLALHPIDAEYPAMLEAWSHVLMTVLETHQPVTKDSMCEALSCKLR